MSVSYTGEPFRNEPVSPYTPRDSLRSDGLEHVERPTFDRSAEEPFVPVYARRGKTARRGGGKIKTWMILAPIGVLVLGGAAAAMLMSEPESSTAPLAEPATPLPATTALTATQPVAAPVAATPAPVEAAPAAEPRRAAPVATRRVSAPTPARRATPAPAPVAARATTPAPTATPTPAPVTTSPTATLNTAPTAPVTPAPTAPAPSQPPAPAIVVQPLG